MTHSSLIITETIELNAPLRPKVEAHRLGALAVHRTLGDDHKWTITHLPTGLHFGFYWRHLNPALNAMVDLNAIALWGRLKATDIETLGNQVYTLLLKHQGRRFAFIPRAISSKDRFNGYDKVN